MSRLQVLNCKTVTKPDDYFWNSTGANKTFTFLKKDK